MDAGEMEGPSGWIWVHLAFDVMTKEIVAIEVTR
jgi:hypothetical protein